jgi:hypothetical protein
MNQTEPGSSDDRVFDAILLSARARTAELQRAYDASAAGGNRGCLMMLASGAMAVGAIVLAFGAPRVPAVFLFLGVVLLAAVIVGLAGWRTWSPWSEANGVLQDGTDDALIRPFVERLVPGAVFTRPKVVTSRYHPSLLFQEPRGTGWMSQGRIEGRIAGLPAVLDEVEGSSNRTVDEGWIARFELPFAVDGHLRIRVPKDLGEHAVWREGFRPLTHETGRLGTAHVIEIAPLGIGMDDGAAPPTGGLHPDALLTDALFEQLRASGDIDVAATARTLWVAVPRSIRAFGAQSGIPPDLKAWHRVVRAWHEAVRAIREIEGIVTAMVAPLARKS